MSIPALGLGAYYGSAAVAGGLLGDTAYGLYRTYQGYKGTRSRTQTESQRKRRRGSDTMTVPSEHAYSSHVTLHRKNRPYPYRLYKTLQGQPKLSYVTNIPQQSSGVTSGIQQFIYLADFMGYTDIASLFTQATSQAPTFGHPTGTIELFINQCTGRFFLKNMTAGTTAFVTLYACMPRIASRSTDDPVNCVVTGIGDQSATATGYEVTGYTPFFTKRFVESWIVLKKWRFPLFSGAHKEVRVNFKVNHSLNNAKLAVYNDASIYNIPGCTIQFFMQAQGGVISYDAGMDGVTTAPVKFGWITEKQYSFQYMLNNQAWTTVTEGLAATTGGQDISVQQGVEHTVTNT